MPGYTHMQRAQPIYLAHYLLAQLEALERDHERLRDARRRADVMPLGSGALAGSSIALDREAIAKTLGFERVSQNSIDAVGDRDFVADVLYSLSMIGVHLSRFSEDLIILSTTEFGFIEFSDAFATGSSLMPQKKNPDMAELIRGKSGRLIGNLMSLLVHAERLADRLQSRSSGGQRSALRLHRHRARRTRSFHRDAAGVEGQSRTNGIGSGRSATIGNRSG